MHYQEHSLDIRRHILEMHHRAGHSHIGSALSCVDLLTVLYFGILNVHPKKPNDPDRDRLVFSKGHAGSALYATLAMRGFFPASVLAGYCRDGGRLPGHVTLGTVPGIEASAGSLGHGLSIGAGMVLGARHFEKTYRTFVMLSDGELDEGSIWEAALFAGHHHLENLTAVIDYNKIQSFGSTKDILDLEPLAEKWKSFGWAVRDINGHAFDEIEQAFKAVPFEKNKPSVVIAHTVKGKGVRFMENKLEWHYKAPNDEQFSEALKELGR